MTTEKQTPAELAAEIKRLHVDYARTRIPGPELFSAIDRLAALAQPECIASVLHEKGVKCPHCGSLAALASAPQGGDIPTPEMTMAFAKVFDVRRQKETFPLAVRAMLAAAPAAPVAREPLPDAMVDDLSREMVKGGKSVNWLCRAIEKAHGIGITPKGST